MDDLKLWQQKLLQLLHDPPAKAFFIRGGTGGHKLAAGRIFAALTGLPLRYVNQQPDFTTAGADRPVCSPPSRTKDVASISADWVKHPILTHPLASGKPGKSALNLDGISRPRTKAEVGELGQGMLRSLSTVLERHPDEDENSLSEEQREQRGQEELVELRKLPLWEDPAQLREICLQLWRRWPDLPPDQVDSILWTHQPADSRTPDHSLWDHVRLASALAFMPSGKKAQQEPSLRPWFFTFSIGPVQRFIEQSRTSSDLWTSSFLFSDLIWHAMLPLVEQYGPEAIIYPDLRGNPRADLWLVQEEAVDRRGWRVIPEGANPLSFAGMFPNRFVALIPQGGNDTLPSLETLGEAARKRVLERWHELAELTKAYFLENARRRNKTMSAPQREAFERIWARQHQDVLSLAWSAVEWRQLEKVKSPDALAIRQALPAQTPAAALSPDDQQALDAWRGRHSPWIPAQAFASYAEARHVYAKTNLGMHQLQRGFDYPLIHHALHSRHMLRKAAAPERLRAEEAGEKCTLCGQREALGTTDDGTQTIDQQRKSVRSFWSDFVEHNDGGERLCAVCTMKRLLIRSGVAQRNGEDRPAGLTELWAGPRTPMQDVLDRDGKLRVPFPSTATLAAQSYLCAVAKHPGLRSEVAQVVQCSRKAELRPTTFQRALRALVEVEDQVDDIGRQFLEFEAELTVFPEAITNKALGRETKSKEPDPVVTALRTSVQELLTQAAELNEREREKGLPGIPLPCSQVAVIAIDGDRISKLLLGTSLGAKWRDVIHPTVIERMAENVRTLDAGWPDLLNSHRLMGPSTHAFVNRVLASFAHEIVPWVVEREFHGSLIYAGGDDALILAPASEALDISARLAQLYSAAWVLDLAPEEKPWSWRQRKASVSQERAPQSRFVVVAPGSDGKPVPWPIPESHRIGAIQDGSHPVSFDGREDAKAQLLPMMGPGQTLSAGIALGHYKTPLGELVRAAWEERERAKGKPVGKYEGKPLTSRNAFSIRRYSRGGEKARLTLSWGDREGGPSESFNRYSLCKKALSAFAERKLSGKLPYKLREVEEAVIAAHLAEAGSPVAGGADRVRAFAQGLFHGAAGGEVEVLVGAFEIWWQGLLGAFRAIDEGSASADPTIKTRGFGSEQGLSVCRFLGSLTRGSQGQAEEEHS